MAFGSWIKKIGDKVKSFGEKVKNVAEKALPYIEKGSEFIRDTAGPAIEKFGNSIGSDTISNVGRGAVKVGDTVNRWANKDSKYLNSDQG